MLTQQYVLSLLYSVTMFASNVMYGCIYVASFEAMNCITSYDRPQCLLFWLYVICILKVCYAFKALAKLLRC